MEQDSKINPITGKPVEYSISPITGKPLIPKSTGLGIDVSMQIPTYKTQDKLESYLQYGTPQSALFNLDEERALRQSRTEKWRNGAAKMLTTAVGSFAEGTIGVVDGLAEALIYKDSTKLYNHHLGRAIDDMNEWMSTNLPNYYTEEEQNAKGLASLGYANFWADKGLNGLGYMIGTMGSVYTGSGALNLAGKGLKGASTALKGLNFAKAVATGNKVSKVLNSASTYGAQAAKAGKTATLGLVSAYAEASVEAREVLKHAEEQARIRIAMLNGVDPDRLTSAQLQQAKKEATDAGNLAFALNIVTVGASNLIMFGKLMSPKFFNAGKVKAPFTRNAAGLLETPKTTLKSVGKMVGTGFATEAFQEGTQFAIQEKAIEMAAATDINNIDGSFGLPEMVGSLIEGWQDTLSSKEGLDSVMVGAIIGMLGGGFGAARQAISNKENQEAHKRLIDALNNPQLFKGAERAESIQRLAEIIAKKEQARKNNDHKEYRDGEFEFVMEQVLMHLNAGSIDFFFERLNDESAKDFDTFAEDWNIPEEITKSLTESEKMQLKSDLINGVKNKAEKVVEIKNKVDAIAPDMSELTLVERALMNDEQKADYLLQQKTLRAYKKQLIQNSATIEDVDSRVEKIKQEINELTDVTITENEISPLVKQAKKEAEEEAKDSEETNLIEDLQKKYQAREELQLKTQEELNNKLNQIRAQLKEKNPTQLQEFEEKQRDLKRLAETRSAAVNALNNLYASPKEREAYMQVKFAEEATKVQEQYNKKFEQAVNATNTAKELGELLQQDNPYVSAQAKATAVKTQLERAIKEKQKQQEFETNSLDELKAMDRSNMEKWETMVLDEIIQDMEEKGETKARRKKPKAAKKLTSSKKRRRGRGANVSGNDSSGSIRKGLTDETDEDEGEGKKRTSRGRKKKGPSKAQDRTVDREDRAIDYTVTRQRSNGTFQLQNGKVLVDKDGTETLGDLLEYNLVNDTDPFVLGRELLRKGVIQPGTKVTFEVVETDYWKNGGSAVARKNNTTEQSIPIFVFVEYDGKKVPIGNLRSGFGFERNGNKLNKIAKLSGLRQQVYEAYESEDDVVIESTVKEVDFSNMFNAVTEDGKSYFYNPFESLGEDVSIGIVRLNKDGSRNIDITPNNNLSEEDKDLLNETVVSAEERGSLRNIPPGSVVFFHKEANGTFQLTKGHTDTLSETPINRIYDLIKEFANPQRPVANIISDIESIVATNSIVYNKAELMQYFMAFDIIDGQVVLGFKGLTKEGTDAIENYIGKDKVKRTTVIRIPAKLLAELLNGRVIEDAESVFGEEERAEGYGLISEAINVEKDGKTFVNFRGIARELNESEEKKATQLLNDIPTLLQNLLERKRYNVDVERLNDREYVDSLLQPNEESENTGFTGIISTDSKLVDGSVFIDIGVNFEDEFTVDGKQFKNSIVGGEKVDPGVSRGRVVKRKQKPKKQSKQQEQEEEEESEKPKGPPSRTFGGKSSNVKYVDNHENKEKENNKKKKKQATKSKDNTSESKKEKRRNEVADALDPTRGRRKKSKKSEKAPKGKPSRTFTRATTTAATKRANIAEAKQWLQERGIDVSVFSSMQQIGNATVHGYVESSSVYLWDLAEVGTEYHEAFHVVFRSMLSDAQRQGLYEEESSRYGEATAEEIAAIKEQFPDFTQEEAISLAYEERMAERFRDYVLTEQELGKTLGGKLRKFFRDLWNYIKAIFSHNVGMRQLYSLIEDNRIPKKYARTAQILDGNAFRVVKGFEADPETYNDLVDVLATRAIYLFNQEMDKIRNSIDSRRAEKELVSSILGNKETNQKTGVAQFYIEHSMYVDDENRSKLPIEKRAELIELLKSKNDFESLDDFLDAVADFMDTGIEVNGKTIPFEWGVPIVDDTDLLGILYENVDDADAEDYMVLKDEEELRRIGIYFYQVYDNWFGEEDEFGNVTTGFRDEVIKTIKPAGYNIKTQAIAKYDDNVEDVLEEDEHDEQDKYYFAESIEFNRKDKISGQLRQLIGNMVGVTRNSLGAKTFLNIDKAYRVLVSAAVDSRGLSDMLAQIESGIEDQPELKAIYYYLTEEASPEEIAGFRSFFSLGYDEQTYILEEAIETEEDEETRLIVTKFGGADTKTARKSVFREWKKDASQLKAKKPNALYLLKYDEDGKFESRKINNDVVNGETRTERISAAVQSLNDGISYYSKGNNASKLSKGASKLENVSEFNGIVEGIALAAWNLGLQFGKTEEEAVNRVKSYLLNNVRKEDRYERIRELRSSLFTLIKENFETLSTSDGKLIQVNSVVESPNDMFSTETSSVYDLTDVLSTARPAKATSHVDPTGKIIYPYNLRSQLSRLIDQMNDPDSELLNELYAEDPFISGLKNFEEETVSELYRLLKDTDFELAVTTINSLLPVTEDATAESYKKMTIRNSLISRLNLYLNNGSKDAMYAVPVQETRGKFNVLTMPKWSNPKSLKRYGGKTKTKQELIKSIVMRDLYRAYQDPEVRKKLDEGRYADIFVLGDNIKNFVITKEMSERMQGLTIADVIGFIDESDTKIIEAIDQMVDDIVNNVLPSMRDSFINELTTRNIAQIKDNALELEYPKDVAEGINEGSIQYIQGRKTDLHSTNANPKPLRIGNKYYYARHAIVNGATTTFENFASEVGGKQKALKLLGVEDVNKVNKSLKEFIEGKRKIQLLKLQEVSAKEAGIEQELVLNRISESWSKQYSTLEEFIDAFVIDDMIARSEMIALFRGGIGQAKSLSDVFKRMGLIGTPGTETMLEGEIAEFKTEKYISEQLADEESELSQKIAQISREFGGKKKEELINEAKKEEYVRYYNSLSTEDKEYGMLREVRQAAIEKFELLDEFHDVMAEEYRRALAQDVNVKYTEDELDRIVDTYRRNLTTQSRENLTDISDAFAIISPTMAMKMNQGQGKWGQTQQDQWDAFEKSGYSVYVEDKNGERVVNQSNLGYSEPFKPSHSSLVVRDVEKQLPDGTTEVNKVLRPELDKNAYFELRPELVAGKPLLEDLYNRMMAIGKYEGMKPIHLINTRSAKKGDKEGIVRLDQSAEFPAEGLLDSNVQIQKGENFILPQSIAEKNDEYTRINRQIRKNQMAGLALNEDYTLEDNVKMKGEDMFNLYNEAMYTLMKKTRAEVDKKLGVDLLLKNDTVANRINFYKKVKQYVIQQKIERGELDDNMETQLEIIADGFKMPMHTTGYTQAYEGLLSAIYKKEVMKLTLPGKELVQAPGIGGMVRDKETGQMRELKFLSVKETPDGQRIGHAEVLISSKLARKYGIKPGDDLSKLPENLRRIIGYRIPHQGKSSTLIMEVVGFLPDSHSKTIVVPGNITVQMGSDFDVDKLFVLMPEAEAINQIDKDLEFEKVFHYSQSNKNPLDNFNLNVPLYTSKDEEQYSDYGAKFEFFINPNANIKTIDDFDGKYKIDLDKYNQYSNGLHPYLITGEQLNSIRQEGVDILIDDWGEYIIINPAKALINPESKTQYQRVKEEYNIDNIKNASIAQIRNTILSIVESVASDIKHAGETLAPLDTRLLEDIVENTLQKTIDSEYFFGHPLIELEMEAKFKMSQRLVGVYANGMSGASVAIFGRNGETRGTEMHNSKHLEMVEVDEEGNERRVLLDTIQAVSPWTNKSTMYGMIKRLSAAVDAGNTPLSDALNDNMITANAILYMESIGVDEESIALLMNNPLVKAFVEARINSDSYGSTYFTLKNMFEEESSIVKHWLMTRDNKDSEFKKVLSKNALKRVYEMGDRALENKTAQSHFKIFLSMLSAGEQLFGFYRAITPDVMDSMGDIATLEAYRDEQSSAMELGERSLVSIEQIDQFIIGDAYKMQKGFMETQNHIATVLGELFLSPHESVRRFKETLKYYTGRSNLTTKEHKMLERALAWYSMTKPVIKNGEDINPLSKLLTQNKIQRLFEEDNNIWSRLQNLLKKHPLLREVKLLNMIEESESNDSPFARLQRIQFSSMEKLDPDTRNELIREFNLLLNDSDFFVDKEAEQTKGEKLQKPNVTKIISGGQTGADQIGLKVASALGIETGGVAPAGYRTEVGSDSRLEEYGLVESNSNKYEERTEQNVVNSDATVVFGNTKSSGSQLTIKLLKKHNKPYILNPNAEQLNEFLNNKNISVLNVAGNRASKLTAAQMERFEKTLTRALKPKKPKGKKSEASKIKRLAEDLILNAMISTGMAPGYGTYNQLIPIEFFMGLEIDGFSLRDHLMAEFKASKTNPDHFLDALPQIIANYGARKNELGSTLVSESLWRNVELDESKKVISQEMEDPKLFNGESFKAFLPAGFKFKENGKIAPKKNAELQPPLLVKATLKNKKFDKTNILVLTPYGYTQIEPMGLTNQLIEMNIRDASGKLIEKSMISERDTGVNFTSNKELYNPMLTVVQEKIEKSAQRRNKINKDC